VSTGFAETQVSVITPELLTETETEAFGVSGLPLSQGIPLSDVNAGPGSPLSPVAPVAPVRP
jgi:hypothetical protein